jgi:CelD/BcsL family acetyltransferase involved in cellulose biosynthesis
MVKASEQAPPYFKIELLTPDQLCGGVARQWNELRSASPEFASPYYAIEFTKAVARVRDDVRVAVAVRNEAIVSILPYQLNSPTRAVPVGGRLNDLHGIMGENSEEVLSQMLRKSGLKSYAFHSMPSEAKTFEPFQFRKIQSHHMDLTEGWEQFRAWIRRHSSTVKRQGQKTRNLEKEIGPIRFEFDCDSSNVLETLIDMKRSKYQRSKTFDILSVEWAANLLREIHTIKTDDFQGLLSAMWAGDELIGVHFGMLCNDILHYWFPVYDPRFSRYSPGTEMMLLCAEEACQRGITKLDLGYGDDAYKFKFCNGHESVACGQVNYSPLAFELAKTRYNVRMKLKNIPLKSQAKAVLRRVFPEFGQWNFR